MKRFFLNWWTLTLLTAVIVAACLALALPIFVHVLRPWWIRLIIGVAVFAIWGVFALLRVMRARRAADAIAEELAAPAPGDAEVGVIAKRMAEALASLRKASGSRRDYLYSRPWYMIIGPPGAGKTTALLNSGLRFPFSDAALKGVGGTRNLDFWFADEAALVDTAGRYTTQDSDAPADAAAWRGFLRLLRKHRPLQPINGVLVAIGLDELLRASRAELDAHAAAVRRRLAELRGALEVSAPVYVLFTKADLLAGFVEFYEDLDVEGRRAVLGATLPVGQATDGAALAGEFDAFAQSVADRASKRLQEEPDARRRGLILGFPGQVETLRARVLRFLDGAFLAGGEPVGQLRGFYLTSGVQEGSPLDRLLGGVAAVYDQPQAPQGQGRAYFLNRLLNEVVFAESGLVQDDPAARARRRLALTGGLVAVAGVVALTLILWAVSFVGNRNLQGKLLAGAQNAKSEAHDVGIDLVEVKASDPDLEQSLSVLRALRDLPGGYADQHKHGRPLLLTFGLYQSGHAEEADQAYIGALQRILLPRIWLRLESYLNQHKADPLALYEALKVYLMLGGQHQIDVNAVKSWVESDWANDSLSGADRQQTRDALGEHLEALMRDGQTSDVWPAHQAPIDPDLVASARQAVQQLSLSERAYAILKQKAANDGSPWRASQVLASGDGRAFAGGDAILRLSVPYFFTKEGFQKSYLGGLQTVQEDLRKDAWVLGSDANTTAVVSQMRDVRSGVAADYARDYIAAWEGVVKALQPADYFHDPVAFGAFTRTPSPLTLVLLELRKNTTFSGGASGAAAGGMMQRLNSRIPGASKAVGAAGGGNIDAGQQIENYFKPVADYVGDGKTGPLVDFIAAIKSAAAASAGAAAAGGGMGGAALQGQLATAIGGLATSSAGAPPILQGFVAAAVQGGKTAQVSSAQGAVADSYRKDLLPICQSAVDNHYPFFGAAPGDAAVTDVMNVFGANGAFQAFARDRLGSLLNKVGPVWRWSADDPVGATLDPTAAENFHRADEIHDLLTTGLPFQVESAGFGGAVTAVEFSLGGTPYRLEPGAAGAKPFMWSVSQAPEAHVTLFNGTKALTTIAAQGPWALFRLMDKARQENAGPTAFKATFGEGATFATLKIDLNSDRNPFRRGSLWSFRCPSSL
ncbi:MAG TPA: type VI secretion system membrane subunit TssM [Caulobacteraceae bacterium]|nr:type VI secretion system membrane subunit TssM [Caulobacteraceae bacterium]